MNIFLKHARSYILRGILAAIPLFLCVLAVTVLYESIDKRLIGARHIPGLGFLLLLVCLYVIGLVVSSVIGKQVLKLIGATAKHIPVVGSIYTVAREFADHLSLAQDKQILKKVFWVNYAKNDKWAIGFMTGVVKDERTGENLLKFYIPTAHPIMGFLFLAKESQVMETGWTVEEALKMVISWGIISPR